MEQVSNEKSCLRLPAVRPAGSRGQFFIVAAFVIVVVIAELSNSFVYSSQQPQVQQALASEFPSVLKGFEREVAYVMTMNPENSSRMNDFKSILGNYSEDKNFVFSTSSASGDIAIDNDTCSGYANCSIGFTCVNRTDEFFNITSKNDDYFLKVRTCYAQTV